MKAPRKIPVAGLLPAAALALTLAGCQSSPERPEEPAARRGAPSVLPVSPKTCRAEAKEITDLVAIAEPARRRLLVQALIDGDVECRILGRSYGSLDKLWQIFRRQAEGPALFQSAEAIAAFKASVHFRLAEAGFAENFAIETAHRILCGTIPPEIAAGPGLADWPRVDAWLGTKAEPAFRGILEMIANGATLDELRDATLAIQQNGTACGTRAAPRAAPEPGVPAIDTLSPDGIWRTLAAGGSIRLPFDFARAAAGGDADLIRRIEKLRAVLEAHAAEIERVLVIGHTDACGPADRNLALGHRRADEIAARILAHGFVVGATSDGESGAEPISAADCATATGKASVAEDRDVGVFVELKNPAAPAN